jgi:hypothetical protein
MFRTFMMVTFVLSLVTISYAQESFNQICSGRSDQPPMIQDCKDRNYQQLINIKVELIEKILKEKGRVIDGLLRELQKEADLQNLTDRTERRDIYDSFKKVQKAFETYRSQMDLFESKVINKTHKSHGDIDQQEKEKQCMRHDLEFGLLSSHIRYLDGKMRAICGFYSKDKLVAPGGMKIEN